MKTGFKDPIAKKNKQEDVKNPWSFKAPEYDERTGRYLNAGTDYGVGHNQPVGHHGDAKQSSEVLPKGRVKTMSLYPSNEKSEIE